MLFSKEKDILSSFFYFRIRYIFINQFVNVVIDASDAYPYYK